MKGVKVDEIDIWSLLVQFLNQQLAIASDGSDRPKDQKTLRRLAQNREAARKSRLRKKAYVQQLESSRMKLTQLEQELQRARQQGIFISGSGDQSQSMSGNGMLIFCIQTSIVEVFHFFCVG
ncbi:transcription factor HBP-1b(c38)-like [Capsicum annuum]|uniref:transcription factor HBP-1b(c38)-like n=1 Tax=Capsicum annuum TaxID=4072 RepID=UPI001FB19EC7|nr:transcription factor HBP-1b(c38)-like [Capsicum annuum]